MINEKCTIEFIKSGRGKARCQPNPHFPNGVKMFLHDISLPFCTFKLPYPAKECGLWRVDCLACGQYFGVTAAGRPDDPIEVSVNCFRRGKELAKCS